jgi:serine-type D-Ala-D-Ala carboxypeptidase (penicillin-binding protein 5/6)
MQNRKLSFYLLIILPLVLLVLVNVHLIVGKAEKKETIRKETAKEKYYRTFVNKVALDTGWKIENIEGPLVNQPEIAGTDGLVADNKSGKVFFSLNPSEKRPIASLVKIMTAIVALEHGDLDQKFVVSERAASVGENAMGISVGEIYSLRELLYGMLLNSGNDAATAVAEGVAEDEKTFVEWMNIRASELGLINTYFADPSGLDDSSYSTAEDLTVLAHFALEHEEFRNIVRTVEKEYSYSEEHKYISLYNQTNLLTTYPGVLGVKTGYTEEAGLCLVTYAVNEGREIIGVVLNSIDRKGDMIRMLDSGFSGMGIRVEHHLLD